MSWSAAQYTKFEEERTRPVRDLLAQVPHTQVPHTDVKTAADIGCGPGNSTELLKARFPLAAVTGMDSSADMIAAAQKRLPDLHFEVGDIAAWRNPGPFDVILANASLQWVGEHETLLPALVDKLAPGGSFAVQTPDNWNEPALALMRETAANGPWAEKLRDASSARAPRHGPDWYYRLLRERVTVLDIWRTTYFHTLAGTGAIVEWFKGSGLRLYLDPLDAAERAAYLATYEDALAKAYPALPDGTVLLPFPRLFYIATR